MKHEARFQIRGEVADLINETYGESTRFSMILSVQVAQDKKAQFKIGVWGEDLCGVARACKGRHVLVVGRMSGGINKAGYYNSYLNADAILTEPISSPQGNTAGGRQNARTTAPTPKYGQAGGQQQTQQPKPEDPLPWEGEEDDDIPF